jgi:hypothetical protein
MCFVVLIGFQFHNGQCALGALPKAGTQAVAEALFDQSGFSIYDLEGAFGTQWYAQSAPITALFVNGNDLSFRLHRKLLV